MAQKRTKNDYIPHSNGNHATHCHWQGCREPGEYKAPKSKDSLHEYEWYCLEHIREYNRKWDFFAGMNSEQIEEFRHEAVTGHRPTWSRESRMRDNYSKLQDAIYEFITMSPARHSKPVPNLPPKIRKALALLDLEYPFAVTELKSQYRGMVKKFHPDVNKGDKQAEETFKRITVAYKILADHVKNL
jgi:curved DNA-binding protein CbpA